MKKFIKEFKEFALKGNVMNLAVGVIIGAAFQGVVSSLTENIISPIIGMLPGQNFDAMEWTVFEGGPVLRYGAFVTSVIDFLIMAFVIFLMVKMMNRFMSLSPLKKEEAPKAPSRKCPYCLSEVKEEATRCPACTSHLPEAAAEIAQDSM